MEDIAGFLLDVGKQSGLVELGESVLNIVAPEINKAIDATNDLISNHALDLAKALDLSGAFIPGNPLAFGPALELAKALTSVIPGAEQNEVLGAIERLKEQVAPFTQRSEDVLQQMDAVIKTGQRLENETHDKVYNAAILAYKALEDAVNGLLAIQPGTARIQRADPNVLSKLDLAVERFANLHQVSDTNAWKLGKDASALMSFGDNTKTFKSTLLNERDKLRQQLKTHEEARARHKQHLDRLENEIHTYASRRKKAYVEMESWENQLAFVFKPSAKDKYTSTIKSADEGIRKTKASQRSVDTQIRGLYLLDTLINWALRALGVVTETVARVAQDFQAKFQHITTAQQTADRLFAGLLDLANRVRDTEFRTTRDSSLRVVLEVLRRYHELRAEHRALEIPGIEERRVHRAICEGLGEEGVKRLLEPAKPVDYDDAVNAA